MKVLFNYNYLTILAVLLAILSCSPKLKIQSEEIRPINRKEFQSFKFFNPGNQPPSNFSFSDENKKILFDAAAEELKNRGLSSSQDAKLLVKIQGGTTSEIQKSDRNYTYSPYYYNNWYYPYQYDDYYRDISKKQTTIIIDVMDAESKKLLWQGVATGEMGKNKDEVRSKLIEAIQLIFAEFPLHN